MWLLQWAYLHIFHSQMVFKQSQEWSIFFVCFVFWWWAGFFSTNSSPGFSLLWYQFLVVTRRIIHMQKLCDMHVVFSLVPLNIITLSLSKVIQSYHKDIILYFIYLMYSTTNFKSFSKKDMRSRIFKYMWMLSLAGYVLSLNLCRENCLAHHLVPRNNTQIHKVFHILCIHQNSACILMICVYTNLLH